MMVPHTTSLPVDEALPRLREVLTTPGNAVLSAAPGAGKTTRVPIALLGESWLVDKRILMLEPRRLAARRSAEYMAAQLRESVGRSVGYRIRGEAKVGRDTRIEIVTEGILTRMLHHDQELPGVGLVIFDEFHERSIHADLGLALTLDVQKHLRPDLRILVMSATLDGVAVAELLGTPSVVESSGRMFPVDTRFAPQASEAPVEQRMADAILRSLRNDEGNILAFLPGIREIRRTEERLMSSRLPEDVHVHLLFGDAGFQQQSDALAPPPPGVRKVILSTSIAETSLTIEGVRVVIDSGLARTSRFEPRRGMSGLVTTPVSKATADQRRGRAGRTQPGICYRLWREQDHELLPAYPTPEIKASDLAHFALDLARWGDPLGEQLRFLDPPPPAHLGQAWGLLQSLGALDREGKMTRHGKAIGDVPLHPRLAHMIVRGKELGFGASACRLGAMLEERNILAGRGDADIDLQARWYVIMTGRGADRGPLDRIQAQSERLRELANVSADDKGEPPLGVLLGLAYPDRVAKRKEGSERYQMSGGATATLPKRSMLARHEFLAVGDVDGAGTDVRIFLAAPLSKDDVETIFEGQIVEQEDVRWNPVTQSVVVRMVRRAGALDLGEGKADVEDGRIIGAMIEGIRNMGIDALPWTKETRSFVARSEWVRLNVPGRELWPECSAKRLLDTLDAWLASSLSGVRKKEQLARVDIHSAITSLFSHAQLRELDRLAPERLPVPSGSKIALDYTGEKQPSLGVKLQELFGLIETPRVGGGTIPVVIHLLSPAGRPLAVTQDLRSFWKNTYPELRGRMRARYPRHPWPEDPLTAVPTKKTVRRKKQ